MLLKPTKQSSYSLIELLVVIGVITIVGLTSIPNIFNRNDRLSLNTSAGQIRQLIIDARTRSLAPDKNDISGSTQQYQVVFGTFSNGTNPAAVSAEGGITTNTVTLERGLAQCDTGDVQGAFSTLRNLTLPRGIYISNFYPANFKPSGEEGGDDKAAIRFTVGQEGFVCGGRNNPNFYSGIISQSGWSGKRGDEQATTARYLSVELSSQRVSEKRYVFLDRFTGEVTISRTNSQSYFTPKTDSLAPKWKATVVDTFPNDFKLTVDCGASTSDVTLSFNRALDRVDDALSEGDPNLYVAYDISWNTGSGSRPLEIGYFYNLAENVIRYHFSTDSFTYSNQPISITVNVIARDGIANEQPPYTPPGDQLPADQLKGREKEFRPSCGAVVGEDPTDPRGDVPEATDPGGGSQSCNPVIVENPKGIKKVFSWFIDRVYAIGNDPPPLIIPLC